jgi:DNA repair exonuclease SbcCD ATPase subunit
LQE